MKALNKCNKENKLIRILILVILLVLIFFIASISFHKTENVIAKQKAVAEMQIEITDDVIDITTATTAEGNTPRLGAGMIPVIYDPEGGTYEITTADDPNWYDYKETGRWASVMLSDGEYISEPEVDMLDKELATPGVKIREEEVDRLGTIFTWIPRLAYKDDEVVFLAGTNILDYYYTTNDCFNEELYGIDQLDIGYEGFWVSRKEYATANEVASLNTEMNKEDNKWGIIKNEVVSTITSNEKLVINKLIGKYDEENDTMIINSVTNKYRQVIKILNVNRRLPMTVTHTQDGPATILDTEYNANEVLYFFNEYGDKLEDNKFIPNDELYMTFYGVDSVGNIRKHYVKLNNIKPDLTGFNPNTTFFVTYDEEGNESSYLPIGEDTPYGWSNYYNSKWANIVTRNDGNEIYFTWIPRYQYKLDTKNQKVIAEFIDIDTEISEGYKLPEAFTWTDASGKTVQLKGYWITKYRLSANGTYKPNIQGGQNIIDVKGVVSTIGEDKTYEAYLIQDGKIVRGPIEIDGDYTFEEVDAGDYVVNIIVKNEDGSHNQGITKQVTVINKSYPNVPDLTGLNKDKTFYVTYDEEGNEESSVPIGEAEPENWYDYDKQQWANIVVRENGLENYYVWIPRYQYKLDDPYQDSYVEFISVDKSEADTGYKIPDAFIWYSDSGEKVQLSGYWMSKYELRNDGIKRLYANVIADTKTIKINSLESKVTGATKFEVTLIKDGKRLMDPIEFTDTYTFEDLDQESYVVYIVARNDDGKQLAGFTKEIKLLEPEVPDLTGFNPDTTFYVTYDEEGNEESIIPIGEDAPENWYNYLDQKWANLVVRNNGDELYYVWIPRYQYILDSTNQKVYTEFIPTTKTTADTGYKIPEAFTWTDASGSTKQLAGYWMSKYRLSATSTYRPNVVGGNNVIDVAGVVEKFGEDYTYEAYLIYEGVRIRGPIEITGNYRFEDVDVGEYSVHVVVKDADGHHVTAIVKQVIVTTHTDPNPPDLTGLNKDKTFYVTYNAEGKEESIIPIGEAEPENWYDYDEQQWANIVVRENGLENYYVWIPRYEYKLDDPYQDSYILFIPSSQTEPDNGYIIPDAFSWTSDSGEKVQLEGYWMSKYELRNDGIKRLHANVITNLSTITVNTIDNKVSGTSFELALIKNGVRIETVNITDSYTFENLEESSYVIHLIARDANGNQLAGFTKEVKLLEPEAPDLTGFNPDTTFFVTYDEEGNEESIVPIGEGVPENWYNYKEQLWANIVVRNNGDELYYVWIPRYQYILDSTNQKVYTEFIPQTKATADTGYKIPEAFTWTDASGATKQLKGYWMSKYRLSATSSYRPDIEGGNNIIDIKNVVSTLGSGNKYETYLIQNGVRIRGPIEITGDYTYKEVPVGDYAVFIVVKDADGNHLQGIIKQVTVTTHTDPNPPDLTGLNKDKTFYVTYNESGVEESVIPIGEDEPDGWYDYDEQQWANIVVRENGLENYYVWIPRYQYRLVDAYQDAYVQFIPASKETADTGYKIPDAFTWMDDSGNTIQLEGYWMSKYELRDDGIKRLYANVISDTTSIKVNCIESKVSATKYELALIKDGKRLQTVDITDEYIFENLEEASYVVHLIARDASGKILAGFTTETYLLEPEAPDLTGFNPDTTFFVTYDENGNENSLVPIGEGVPDGWYDYREQLWANIVVRNNGDELYYVWIPRYEYILDSTNKKVYTRFIPATKATADTGYKIPEAFTWTDASGATKQLKGYWMSKYRLSASSSYRPDIAGELNKVVVKNVVQTIGDSYKYEIYLIQNGIRIRGPIEITGDYTFEDVPVGDYSVFIDVQDENGKHVQGIVDQVKVFAETTANEPDLTGLNPSTTFYVTYDENGKEQSVIPIGEAAPEDWYSYSDQKWANIVVRESGFENYYVWIPRYQYKLVDVYQDSYIQFIPASKETADEGYKIPDAFTWMDDSNNTIQLPGYWMSKYELRDDTTKRLYANVITDISSITVNNIESKVTAASFELALIQDGVRLQTVDITDTYEFENLDVGTYIVHLIAKDANGYQLAGFAKEVTLAEPEIPDVTGFNVDKTFIITEFEEGGAAKTTQTLRDVLKAGAEIGSDNELISGDVDLSKIDGTWYDYKNQLWANVVTRNGSDEIYFVWIPRYEYILDSTNKRVYTRFIPTTKTTADTGYKIPEAFTWTDASNKTVQLRGYWMTKYRLSASQN